MKTLAQHIQEKLVINKKTKSSRPTFGIINMLLNNPEDQDDVKNVWALRGYIGESIRSVYDYGISEQIQIKDKVQNEFMPIIQNVNMGGWHPKNVLFKRRLDVYTQYYDKIKNLLLSIQKEDDWKTIEVTIGGDDKMLLGVSDNYCVLGHYDKEYETSSQRFIYNLMIKEFK